MATLDQLRQTRGWQEAEPEDRRAMLQAWKAARSDPVRLDAYLQLATGNFPQQATAAAPTAAGATPRRTIQLQDVVPGARTVNRLGGQVVGGMGDIVRGLPQIPGMLRQLPGQVIETGRAIAANPREAIPATAKELGQVALGMLPMPQTLGGAARAVASGDPRQFNVPADVVAREAGQLVMSAALSTVVPSLVKRAARTVIREAPGAAVELHSLAIPKARAVPGIIRPTAGAARDAYDALAAVGNPTLYMGKFRRTAMRLLQAEEKLANPDRGFIHEMQNYLASSRDGWSFDQVKTEAEELGARIGGVRTNTGATATEAPRGMGRKYDKKLKRLFSAMHEDVEKGRPLVVQRAAVPPGTPQPILGPGGQPMLTRGTRQPMMTPGTPGRPAKVVGGKPTQATVLQSQLWKQAARLARRDFAANGLARMVEDAITVAGDQYNSINVNAVLRKLEKAKRLSGLGNKRARLFVGSFDPGELNRITATLKDIGHRLPRIPPMYGAITGSSQRVLRAAGGVGLGAALGALSGGTAGAAEIGGVVGGVFLPELVAQSLMTDTGRALVRRAVRIDPHIGPAFRESLAGYLRHEAQQPQGGP